MTVIGNYFISPRFEVPYMYPILFFFFGLLVHSMYILYSLCQAYSAFGPTFLSRIMVNEGCTYPFTDDVRKLALIELPRYLFILVVCLYNVFV